MIGAFEGEWGYVGHELLAGSSHTRRHRSREHHDLLLARGCFEDLLHSLPHVLGAQQRGVSCKEQDRVLSFSIHRLARGLDRIRRR